MHEAECPDRPLPTLEGPLRTWLTSAKALHQHQIGFSLALGGKHPAAVGRDADGGSAEYRRMPQSCHFGRVAPAKGLEADDPARSRGGGLLVDEVEALGRQIPAAG